MLPCPIKLEIEVRHYQINGSEPQENKQWRKNIVCHVVADNAIRAMELAMAKHPNMDIFALNHRGEVDIIEDA